MPIFTISKQQKEEIQNHLKRLGSSTIFPQCVNQVSNLSHHYDLKKVFDDIDFPDENYLMEQMEKGTKDNFPDVVNGDQQSLVMLPDKVFHYGKGKDQVIIHIQLILEKIKKLEEQIKGLNAENLTNHQIGTFSYLENLIFFSYQ